jgi:hypothetical protein
MRAVIALVFLLSAPAGAADYLQPKGAPEIFVPVLNVTVSVFAVQTPVGHGIGVFEKRNGEWFLCGQCLVSPEVPSMDAAVKSAGGADAYVAAKRDAINTVLARRYPASGVQRSEGVVESVNQALVTGFVLRIVDGIPQLGSR